MNHKVRLVGIAEKSSWFLPALVAVRNLNLPCWCIGAGAVRTLVWDSLHEFHTPSVLSDVDVAYFDASDLSTLRDEDIQHQLTVEYPQVPWEVTNQAAVHTWYGAVYGHAVSPFSSLEEAVASWPEYSTAVGVTLRDDDQIDVVAPYGLEDLFSMIVRRNPARVSIATYRQRVQEKQYQKRWPRVIVVP